MTTTEQKPPDEEQRPTSAARGRDPGVRYRREPVAVYEPTRRVPPLRSYLRGVIARWPFMWNQARSDLKADNYNTVLGQVWLILNPLLLAFVFVFGRSVLRPIGNADTRNFLIAHLVGGLFFYQYVVQAWQEGTRSITSHRGMILNSAFPRAVYPLSTALRAFLEFVPLLVVLMVTRLLLAQPFGLSLVALPVVILMLALFALGLSLGSSAILVFFPDFNNLIALCTRLWLWATPILYTIAEIPPSVKPYVVWNPLYPFYGAMEQIFAGDWPSLGYMAAAAAWTTVAMVVGSWIFLTREREFAVRI